MEVFLNQVANLGFPIVVSFYLLVRVEGKLDMLAATINQLTQAILRFEER